MPGVLIFTVRCGYMSLMSSNSSYLQYLSITLMIILDKIDISYQYFIYIVSMIALYMNFLQEKNLNSQVLYYILLKLEKLNIIKIKK